MKTIMIIEDDYAVRLLFEEELSNEGYSIISSANGEEIMEIIGIREPDLILLDIKFRGAEGFDLLHKIKSRHPLIPVVLCTAYEGLFQDMRSLAADGYVVKSSNLDPLKQEIDKVMRLNRRNAERDATLFPNAETGLGGEWVRTSSPL